MIVLGGSCFDRCDIDYDGDAVDVNDHVVVDDEDNDDDNDDGYDDNDDGKGEYWASGALGARNPRAQDHRWTHHVVLYNRSASFLWWWLHDDDDEDYYYGDDWADDGHQDENKDGHQYEQ